MQSQLSLNCLKCDKRTVRFDSLFQRDDGLLFIWKCPACKVVSKVLIAGVQMPTTSKDVPNPVEFTEEDMKFLKENHCYIKEVE